jgi:phosphoribosylamine--glycine ligase
VLAVTSYGKDVGEAVSKSKNTLSKIYFEGMNYRGDIGHEFM